MNDNEAILLLQEMRRQNETYYDLMRDTVWRLWKNQDENLLLKIKKIEHIQDEMAESFETQKVK